MPRKPHGATPENKSTVAALKSFGVPQEDIAEYIGIDAKTLRKHYGDILETAQLKANAQVAGFLLSVASGKALKYGASYADCLRGAMFWSKTRMEWRETQKVDHTSTDGSMTPQESKITINASALSDEQLDAILAALPEAGGDEP